MRQFAACVGVVWCVACGSPATPSVPNPVDAADAPGVVDLARVGQSRAEVPAGFEFADLAGRVAPVAQWGFGTRWSAEPPSCAVLADPPVDAATLRGWSASGPGAIVYVVAAVAAGDLDGPTRADCGHFAVAAGHTAGDVSVIGAPTIGDAKTLGLRVETTTVVEGGTETRSHAETLTAHLDGHVAYVTVVTDPGSGDSPLGADFAARLLTSTTSALRSGESGAR